MKYILLTKPKWCTRKTLGWLMLAIPYAGLYFVIPEIMIAATGAVAALAYLVSAYLLIVNG